MRYLINVINKKILGNLEERFIDDFDMLGMPGIRERSSDSEDEDESHSNSNLS